MRDVTTPLRGAEAGGLSAQNSGGLDLKTRALALHRISVGLPSFFKMPSLANPAWSILLSLFIAREEGLDVSLAALKVANHVSQSVAENCIDGLVGAGLATALPDNRGDRLAIVQITARGTEHMRRFLQTVTTR